MPFAAKSAAPRADPIAIRQPALERAAERGLTLFAAPRGYLLSESLAATLAERERPTLWLRLGSEDGDPAAFLVTLIAAAQPRCPGVGKVTLERMRRQPGPTAGWPGLFASLGGELAEALPQRGALVLEHSHHLNHTHPTLGLLGAHLLPALPETIVGILTADQSLPVGALPHGTTHVGVSELSMLSSAAQELAECTDAGLPVASIRRMIELTEGRAVALAGLCTATAKLGPALIQDAVGRAVDADDLLARVARALLLLTDADQQQALALALRLEYSHTRLLDAALGRAVLPGGPWLQALEGDWTRVRAVWHAPLRAALRAGATPSCETLRHAADYLAEQGAIERAVPLYLELGDCDAAARMISAAAETLLNLGQWETLGAWLGQLPAPTLRACPWLIYAGGELAAARGDTDAARRTFAVSAELFAMRHDVEGACQSILAESALAAWQGDYTHARARALAANAAAEAAGLVWHQSWAAWQLGCLAASADLDDALAYFGRAVALAPALGDPFMADLLQQAEDLLLRQRELRRQRELHRQAYFAAERAEREAAERLRRLISAPLEQVDGLLAGRGWAHTPLMLKLPAPAYPADLALAAPGGMPVAAELEEPVHLGMWARLLHAFGLRRRSTAPEAAAPQAERRIATPADTDIPPLLEPAESRSLSAAFYPAALPPASEDHEQTALTSEVQPATASDSPVITDLSVHLLGPLRVTLADHLVESWPSGRGRAIFKYLLAHRGQSTPRDMLMDLFWPDAAPEAARNNLNVAVHGLRQALKAASERQIVLFQDSAYRLNPELTIWIDVEAFERHVASGRQLEANGQLAAATAEYEVATGLYQGDFLADDPYEEWPVLTRERLRVAYLDTLDRLAQLYFSQGQYAACAALCQRTLSYDNCREDAHCRLMRCYSRQSQQHLALRQYQACVEALHDELDVEPAPTTVELYERIRRRERV
jgi:DNA-binding SARP family transcriptional activator